MSTRLSRRLLEFALGAMLLVAAGCGDSEPADGVDDPAEAASQALDRAQAASTDQRIESGAPRDGTDLDSLPPDADLFEVESVATTTTLPGEIVTEYILDIDDCFDRVETLVQGRPRTVTTRLPCSEPHGFQIFSRLNYPAPHPTVYPGDDIVEDFALLSCYQRFAQWADADYETSELEIGVFVPTRENFEDELARYRGIHCWVTRVDGDPLSGTARSSGL